MTVQSINTTIGNTVDAHYANEASLIEGYAEPFVTSLVEREYDLTDRIVEEVVANFGTNPEDVKARLTAAGAHVRPEPEPEPAPTADDAEGGDERLDRIEKWVMALVQTARDAGLTVRIG